MSKNVGSVLSAPEVARKLADILEAACVPYAIGGALAFGYHGPPRSTNDVDLNLFVDMEELGTVLDLLSANQFTLDREKAMASASERGDFVAYLQGVRVDGFLPSIPFYTSVKERVVTVEMLGHSIKVLSAEDLVVFKLLFFRFKDINDIERLVSLQGNNLDRQYIRWWIVDMMGENDPRTKAWDEICQRFPRNV